MRNGRLLRAQQLLELRRPREAEAELRLALSGTPEDAAAHALLAQALGAQERYEEAAAEADLAVACAPDWPFPAHVQARLLLARNRPGEAEPWARRCLELDPEDAGHHALLAAVHLRRRDWNAALEAAVAGLRADPEHIDCNNARAAALVQLGRGEEAGATLEAALARDPEDPHTHANQGWACLHRGEARRAQEHFREALRLAPGLDWARRGMLEALKARHLFYRLMLRYFLWIGRLSGKAQWAVVIGAYLGYRLLGGLLRANPGLRPVLLPLIVGYIGFAASTWLSGPIFNLIVRLDRYGRHLLGPRERRESNLVAAALLAAALCGVLGLARSDLDWLVAAFGFALLCMPIRAAFACPVPWARRAMSLHAAVVALSGLAWVGLTLGLAGGSGGGLALGVVIVFIGGGAAAGWLGQFLAGLEHRR